jgi:hypothetical protein
MRSSPSGLLILACQFRKSGDEQFRSIAEIASTEARHADWPRVYDWIIRLWPVFQQAGFGAEFVEGVNRVSAAYGVVWDFRDTGSFGNLKAQVRPLNLRSKLPFSFFFSFS